MATEASQEGLVLAVLLDGVTERHSTVASVPGELTDQRDHDQRQLSASVNVQWTLQQDCGARGLPRFRQRGLAHYSRRET